MSGQTSDNNKRIAKNTLLLYFRMLFMMVVSLYTSRVILNALGVEDFGIYNVVGGVVAMFSVISSSLSGAISRFITYELGKGYQSKLNKIFSASVTIQLLLSLIIVVLIESVGVWFLNAKMTIPAERMTAANWVLQFSIVTFVINLISVPYNAAIIAHEKMSAFAYISILDAIGKLAIAFVIMLSPIDRLVFYAIMMCAVALMVRFAYGYYCKKHFAECTYHFQWDKEILKKMFSFAGWNFIGAASGVFKTQGINILINLFYGAIANAARGISVQVNTAVASFSNNFMTALNPQITKSYATGDLSYMHKLIFEGTKFSFFLMLFLSLPIMLETQQILIVWLKIVPPNAVGFVRVTLIYALVESISAPLITSMLATGNIKKYQIIVGGTNLLIIPIAYLVLKTGEFKSFPEITIVVAIVIGLINLYQRVYLLRNMIKLNAVVYIKNVIWRISLVSAVSVCISMVIKTFFTNESSVLTILASLVVTAFSSLCLGCTATERKFLYDKLNKLREKIINDRNNK